MVDSALVEVLVPGNIGAHRVSVARCFGQRIACHVDDVGRYWIYSTRIASIQEIDPVAGNRLAGKKSSSRIIHWGDELNRRQQLREISYSHRCTGLRRGLGRPSSLPCPFVTKEPEGLVSLDWPARGSSELVQAQRLFLQSKGVTSIEHIVS